MARLVIGVFPTTLLLVLATTNALDASTLMERRASHHTSAAASASTQRVLAGKSPADEEVVELVHGTYAFVGATNAAPRVRIKDLEAAKYFAGKLPDFGRRPSSTNEYPEWAEPIAHRAAKKQLPGWASRGAEMRIYLTWNSGDKGFKAKWLLEQQALYQPTGCYGLYGGAQPRVQQAHNKLAEATRSGSQQPQNLFVNLGQPPQSAVEPLPLTVNAQQASGGKRSTFYSAMWISGGRGSFAEFLDIDLGGSVSPHTFYYGTQGLAGCFGMVAFGLPKACTGRSQHQRQSVDVLVMHDTRAFGTAAAEGTGFARGFGATHDVVGVVFSQGARAMSRVNTNAVAQILGVPSARIGAIFHNLGAAQDAMAVRCLRIDQQGVGQLEILDTKAPPAVLGESKGAQERLE